MTQKKAALECTKCGARNYTITVCGARNYTITVKLDRESRLELSKFCKHCGEYTLHRQTK